MRFCVFIQLIEYFFACRIHLLYSCDEIILDCGVLYLNNLPTCFLDDGQKYMSKVGTVLSQRLSVMGVRIQ